MREVEYHGVWGWDGMETYIFMAYLVMSLDLKRKRI